MMIYENKRNQDKVKVEASSLSLDVVEVTYISSNKHEAGETAFIKIGTFKRWWSLVEEVVEEADADIKEDIEPDTLVPMPGTEKLEELKKEYTKKKTKKSSVDRTKEIENVHNFLNNLGSFISSEYFSNVNCYKLKRNGKTFAEVYPRRKNIEVRVKEINGVVACDYKDGYKYYLPVHYFVSYDFDYVGILEDLLA